MIQYTVAEGETLYDIAKKFGVSTLDIIKANGAINYSLKPGEVITIPQENTAFIDYEIKRGDTLYQLAETYHTDPTILAQINGLKLYDYIYPGEIIAIPKEHTKLYITKKDDTIRSILENGNTTLEDIERYNLNTYLIPDQLIVGKEK